MKLFQKAWIVRIDPKDENAVPGQPLEMLVMHKFLLNAWLDDGIPLREFGYPHSKRKIKIKWVFPIYRICAYRNPNK